jgi:outer membrane protein assembly factor BamB
VLIVVLQWLFMMVPERVVPGTMLHIYSLFLAPMVGAVALVIWWLFASRVPWRGRGLVLAGCLAMGAAVFPFYDESFGLLGMFFFGLRTVTTAWVLWLLFTPFLPWRVRLAGLLGVFLIGWGCFTLFRFEGVYGDFSGTLVYRWSSSDEGEFQAELAAGTLGGKGPVQGTRKVVLQLGDWPGFRGPNRDSRYTGVPILTDWKQPPPLVWRHRVGPGWSSFAVVGTHLYTQEQRGDDEAVVCYDADTGLELWSHKDPARFSEKMAGPGPRATPTFHQGKVYVQGAAGRLNCLDAATGKVEWTRDIVTDSGSKVPMWGFAASPLIVEGMVVVFAAGPDGKSVLAYHAASGEPAWKAGQGKFSYCSPHLARLGGSDQVLLASDQGLTAFEPRSGKILWEHDWQLSGDMARIVQPAVLNDSDVLIGTGFGQGTRRLHVTRQGKEDWYPQELWTSTAIRPYYNDMVVHQGHIYGFDSLLFTCVSLENGERKWRTRGYGNGQVLLLAEQDLLLVLTEFGEAALVEASPDGHKELGRFQAITGKTWNHPVVAHGRLYVRNGKEAACYQVGP